ncbi:DHHC palmitoyltransferase-domain-containing protein [Multifurca ochricompacta]|uniref:Palmitoyltransferase n=1 Tax=Multifurca ochricompacta TaxID=376703 RepID=A0AAD4M8N8_9AGAM|nr:DHHC palmitoyltransferase-domain-containing protein [Multifurca ochricompacta]
MAGACPRFVFACFKRIERWGDKLTGAAGPFFVAVATLLFITGTLCFLDVILPSIPWPWLTTFPCILIIINLLAHYYFVCTLSPGFASDPPQRAGNGFLWAKKRHTYTYTGHGVHWSANLNVTPASTTKCSKCGEIKPERTHHCRVCNRCVLKYDHHCPCVGLYNERHFVMFMAYVVMATFCFVAFGWPHLLLAVGFHFDDNWEHWISPIVFTIIYFLCLVMCLAIGTMLAWHIWGVSVGETAVESQDHEHYRRVALSRGESFQNSYDLGKLRNLQLFFNIGPDGYPLYTLLFPFRVLPYTDGRSWARRPGLERHHGLLAGEELTDEEDNDN